MVARISGGKLTTITNDLRTMVQTVEDKAGKGPQAG